MQQTRQRRPHPVLMALVVLAFAPGLAAAQLPKPQEVRFDTADKVDIKGTFYPSTKGKAPVVLLLHEFGSNRQQAGWVALAERLQKEGYAVLSFDFRGHNDSVSVDPMVFWTVGQNALTFKPTKDRDQINYKDIAARNPNYYPMLASDIAAAKRYLDQRNDAGDCNTSNLILIGAKQAAALGSLWMATEFNRPHLMEHPTNPALFGVVQDPQRKFEGLDIKAAVWLTMPERLFNVQVSGWLNSATIRDKVPMAFFYGSQDPAAEKSAKAFHALLEKNSNTGVRAKQTKEGGQDLLKKGLGTDEDIVNYLKRTLDKSGNDVWFKREVMLKIPAQLTSVKPYYPLP